MSNLKTVVLQNKVKVISSFVAILTIIVAAIVAINHAEKIQSVQSVLDPELAKAMTYPELTEEDANTLVDWAEEYGIKSHRPMTHENRGGIWSDTMHINIRSQHIRIITKY